MSPNTPRQSNGKKTNKNVPPKKIGRSPPKPKTVNPVGVPAQRETSQTPNKVNPVGVPAQRETSQKPIKKIIVRRPKNALTIRKISKSTYNLVPLSVGRHVIVIAVKKAPNVSTQISVRNGILQINEVTTLSHLEQAPSTSAANSQPNQQQATVQNVAPVPDVNANTAPQVQANVQLVAPPVAPNYEQANRQVIPQQAPLALPQPNAEAPRPPILDGDVQPVVLNNNDDIFNSLVHLVESGYILDVIECPVAHCHKFGPPADLDNHYILKHSNGFITDKRGFDNFYNLEKFLRGDD